MLRASRRVLNPGGRTAFLTIYIAPGLSAKQHRRAVIAGPPGVATRRDHNALLAGAGFATVDEIDVTAEFLETTDRWLEFYARREAELREAVGDERFDVRQKNHRLQSAAIRQGLLRRSLFVAETPRA